MLKELIDTSGYGTYAAISTVLFFVMFAVMLVVVWRMPKRDIDEAEQLPLDSSDVYTQEREA
jgi:hypothetical protein